MAHNPEIPQAFAAALQPYLPMDRRQALVHHVSLPDRTVGAALFADISGFTPLTEALAHGLGPRRGAEEVARQVNRVYDDLIATVHHYGGSVISFAGDAVVCWFDAAFGKALPRAVACAHAMHAAMGIHGAVPLPDGREIALTLKVGVAGGPARRFLVGDPAIQQLEVLAGQTVWRMAEAEHVAQRGEVVVDEASMADLPPLFPVTAWRLGADGRRWAVLGPPAQPLPPYPWPPLPPAQLTAEQLRPWVLPLVYARLAAGQGEFLTELRPTVALFLRFEGLAYDEDPQAGVKLDQFLRWVQALLTSYEGSLLQIGIGDKGSVIYGTFGAPLAHENDVARALLAALALQTPPREMHFLTDIRIGVSQGVTRVGACGGQEGRSYGALGDSVNLAARLMQQAAPGQILVSGAVQQAAGSGFGWQPLPAIQVKGKQAPVAVSALQGTRTAQKLWVAEIPSLVEQRYTLPMVGREAELCLLAGKLALAQQGQGQLVGIVAEAGMGKSRLVAEAVQLVLGQGFGGYGGVCQSLGTQSPYLVWQPVWRQLFGLTETMTLEAQSAQAVEFLAGVDPQLAARLPLLRPVLGLPLPDNELTAALDPQLSKASREGMLVDCLRAEAQRRPLLIILEDLHWTDPLSYELLVRIGRVIQSIPVLILMAYRPAAEVAAPIPAPDLRTLPHFTEIELPSLTMPEAEHLIYNRLGGYTAQNGAGPAPVAPALVSQIAARAEGNPFYIEELLNYLHDQGVALADPQVAHQVALPASLHTLILSRIDRLSEPQKIVLKVASVMGRLVRVNWLVGYYPELGNLNRVQSELDQLSRLDLMPLETPEPELTYLFKHIVTQEVAYESMTSAQQARLHERLAAFLERTSDASRQSLDLLVYHYGRSKNIAKQRDYLQRAAEAARLAYANQVAIDYYTRLLPLLETPQTQIDVLLALGEVLELSGDWPLAEARYQEALTQARAQGDHLAQALSQQKLGSLGLERGELGSALTWLEAALRDIEACAPHPSAAPVLMITLSKSGKALARVGDVAAGFARLERSLALAQAQGDPIAAARALSGLGVLSRDYKSEFERATRLLTESADLAQRANHLPMLADALHNLAGVAWRQGDFKTMGVLDEECLTIRRAIGDKVGIASTLTSIANMSLEMGDFQKAKTFYEEGLLLYRELGSRSGLASSLFNLGYMALEQGDYKTAALYIEESIMMARATGDKEFLGFLLAGASLLYTHQHHIAKGVITAVESLELGQATGFVENQVKALLALAFAHFSITQQSISLPDAFPPFQHSQAHGQAPATPTMPTATHTAHALTLVAAIETYTMAVNVRLDVLEQKLLAQIITEGRQQLVPQEFNRVWHAGTAMSLDEATHYALALWAHPLATHEAPGNSGRS